MRTLKIQIMPHVLITILQKMRVYHDIDCVERTKTTENKTKVHISEQGASAIPTHNMFEPLQENNHALIIESGDSSDKGIINEEKAEHTDDESREM